MKPIQAHRRKIRHAAAIAALLGLLVGLDWATGDDLAFAYFYFLPIILAGFTLPTFATLLAALTTAVVAELLTPRGMLFHGFFGTPHHASIARTMSYCLAGVTISWLTTAYRLQVHRLLALHEITASINSAINVTETLELVVRHSALLTSAQLGYLYLRNREEETITVGAAFGDRASSHKEITFSARNSVAAALMALPRPNRFRAAQDLPGGTLPAPLPAHQTRHVMTAPLIVRGEPIGLILVASTSRHWFSRGEMEGLGLLAEAAAIAIDEAQLYERTEQMAITDSLTGLHNRRYFKQHFELELGRAQRRQGILSLIVFDLDRFKDVNDSYGHLTGDHALREVSRVALTMVRRTDLLARIGGDEFAILLPESNRTDGVSVADKLRLALAETPIEATDGRELRLTISAGVASYPFDGIEMTAIFEAADKALYRAKGAGRNHICPDFDLELEPALAGSAT